jgi:MEMO1 family protein
MSNGPVRLASLAGQWYPSEAGALSTEIETCYLDVRGPGRLPVVNPQGERKIIGMVSPHAGYAYSGAIAAHGFVRLAEDGIPEAAIIIGPRHSYDPTPAIQTSGSWRTPLGDASIHEELARRIAAGLPEFSDGPEAFADENTLELQLPLLQHLYGQNFAIVPIRVVQQNWAESKQVGDAITAAAGEIDVVIIASSDMTHYEPPSVAEAQDKILITLIEKMDPEGLLQTRPEISMCGRGAVAAMLVAASKLGAKHAEILKYGHSGEVMPATEVVGYVSVAVRR